MRTSALALRIFHQIRNDKRTLGLVLIAPLLILTIIYYIFNSADVSFNVGVVDAPSTFVERLENLDDVNVTVTELSAGEARQAVENGDVMAVLDLSGDTPKMYLDASDPAKASQVTGLLQSVLMLDNLDSLLGMVQEIQAAIPDFLKDVIPIPSLPDTDATSWETEYVYGSADGTYFDNFGAPMIGIIVFFLTFLIAGINFLSERTSGTLEKLLSTPIRRGEIISGYTLGFGVLAVIQSLFVTLFVVYVLNMQVNGSIWFVILINLLTAITALTLGILLSTLANSEFQMVQFIPIVIVPQIFLCGLFDLSGGWEVAGYFMPLYYTTNALTEVMLKGSGFGAIYMDLLVLAGLSLIFVLVNSALLRRHRGV